MGGYGIIMKAAAEKAPGFVERLLLPKLSEITGELKAINARIDSTNTRIDATNSKIEEMDKRLTGKIEDMDRRLTSEIESLHELVNLAQRMAIVEAKLKEQESRKD
jgi:predicted nuclease with TOPRIM domain